MAKVSEVVSKYLELRRAKEALDEEHKAKTDKIKKAMGQLESFFLGYFDKTGQTQLKTDEATVFVKTTDYAQVADWDAVLGFVTTNESWEFLEKRISKNAVKDYIQQHNEVPPGVNYGTKLSVNVRKV